MRDKKIVTKSRYTVNKTVKLKHYLSGEANCIKMNSFVQMAEGINFTGTDSLMPPTILKLKKTVPIQVGKVSKLKGKYTYGTSLDDAVFAMVE